MPSAHSRVLVISDIHANITALEAVLAAAGPVETVWCLGDVIGYGPDPNECISRIRALPNLTCMLGNHDAAILGQIDFQAFNYDARAALRWTKSELNVDGIEFLKSLPERKEIGEVTLVHGSPRNPVWEYILDIHTASENFDHFNGKVCMVGHTHMAGAYVLNDKTVTAEVPEPGTSYPIKMRTILNPGSVGQPRDHNPKAAFAFFYPDKLVWEAHRVEYDIASVQRRIKRAGLPFRHAARLEEGW
jgi:diadenosine tetraphosphatase ApaH/serine/threonine PP2A family protein phosphatase